MSPSSFIKAYKNLDHQKKVEFLFPKETMFSYPVVVRRGNTFYDGLFVYRYESSKKKDLAYRPFGWLLISMEDGEVGLMAECRVVDFINTNEYPLGSKVSMELPDAADVSKVKRLNGELFEVYEELRQFAFEENLSHDEVATIVRYKDLFMRLCPRELYPFYHAMSPPFFRWLRLPQPDEPLITVEADPGDVKEYQYQLLILENLQQLVKQFQDKISVDSHKEMLFDELHSEVQKYKNGMIDSITRNMELDVIALIDSLGKSLEAFRDRPVDGEYTEKLLALLQGVEMDLVDVLYRQGVDPYTAPGDEMDVARQTAISTVSTQDAALDKKICARLAKGWEKSGKVIRPERVSVYIYREERPPQANN